MSPTGESGGPVAAGSGGAGWRRPGGQPAPPGPEPAEIAAALRRAGLADVSDTALDRAMYSSDASLYRVVPAVVAHPRDAGEVAAALEVCRSLGVPLTCRGAGTSIAGNAIGTGVVLSFAAHMNRVLALDPDARTATVQPGAVQDQVRQAAARFGLRFGPDPSTRNRCTIGGMIANNACGARSLEYGRTSDNVLALDALTAAGRRLMLDGPRGREGSGRAGEGAGGQARGEGGAAGRAGAEEGRAGAEGGRSAGRARGNGRDGQGAHRKFPPGQAPISGAGLPAADEAPELAALRQVAADGLAVIRTEFGRFPRQVSGYALEHLLPERGFDVRRALVGSEGTLAVVTEATLRLVHDPVSRVLVVLGYPDMASAADAAPGVLAFGPTACEGVDSRIFDVVRARRGPAAVPPLPRGGGWLLVEVCADGEAAAVATARLVAAGAGALEAMVVTDRGQAEALWRIREDGAGLAGRTPAGQPAWPGWEDSAVPPAKLGAYLRELDALLAERGLSGVPYGHFGEGCLHLRLDFPLARADGRSALREFMLDAARLVVSYGGSLSGEHGDGRTRGELLPIMYSAPAIELFRRVKGAFDPGGLLNPGVIADPPPLEADVRVGAAQPIRSGLALAYASDGGDFTAAVHRCVGVGKCVADTTASGGVMCPSYLATRQEKDSTRGRARVLQEMANGVLVRQGWRSPEVAAALELCLACKACASECPAGVDMASYKAEVLHQAHRGRPRPRVHYTLGWLPRWARLASLTPGLANGGLAWPGLGRAMRAAAGIDTRRRLPRFAPRTFRSWYARNAGERRRGGRPAMLMVDTFTNYFDPDIGIAAVRVLEDAGFTVSIPSRAVCCGLTWFSTGQLRTARRVAGRAASVLAPAARHGVPIIGLEPSCTASLRRDSVDLLDGPEAKTVAGAMRTLAEVLASAEGWQPPDLRGLSLIAQPHCHQNAVMGWDADAALLRAAGAGVTRLGGCCGMAGDFGMAPARYDVSAAVAGTVLLPAVRAAPGATVLADGFSCRAQLADLAGRDGWHLAQLLVGGRANGAGA